MQLSLCLVLLLPTSAFAAVSTVVVTAAPSAPTNDPSYTSNSDFQNAILNSTNFYRAEHNASAVTWNNSLASFGADYANGCKFQHSGGPDGENLAEGYSNVTDAVDAWGNERAQYNFKKPGFSEATGHFTQLVWKTTTTVGCGRTFCNGKNGVSGWYLVCEYFPRGNVIGEFQTDVQSQTKSQQCVQGGICSGAESLLQKSRTWNSVVVILVCVLF